jgi:hypothetical protein
VLVVFFSQLIFSWKSFDNFGALWRPLALPRVDGALGWSMRGNVSLDGEGRLTCCGRGIWRMGAEISSLTQCEN